MRYHLKISGRIKQIYWGQKYLVVEVDRIRLRANWIQSCLYEIFMGLIWSTQAYLATAFTKDLRVKSSTAVFLFNSIPMELPMSVRIL